jgi:hypothetical protein
VKFQAACIHCGCSDIVIDMVYDFRDINVPINVTTAGWYAQCPKCQDDYDTVEVPTIVQTVLGKLTYKEDWFSHIQVAIPAGVQILGQGNPPTSSERVSTDNSRLTESKIKEHVKKVNEQGMSPQRGSPSGSDKDYVSVTSNSAKPISGSETAPEVATHDWIHPAEPDEVMPPTNEGIVNADADGPSIIMAYMEENKHSQAKVFELLSMASDDNRSGLMTQLELDHVDFYMESAVLMEWFTTECEAREAQRLEELRNKEILEAARLRDLNRKAEERAIRRSQLVAIKEVARNNARARFQMQTATVPEDAALDVANLMHEQTTGPVRVPPKASPFSHSGNKKVLSPVEQASNAAMMRERATEVAAEQAAPPRVDRPIVIPQDGVPYGSQHRGQDNMFRNVLSGKIMNQKGEYICEVCFTKNHHNQHLPYMRCAHCRDEPAYHHAGCCPICPSQVKNYKPPAAKLDTLASSTGNCPCGQKITNDRLCLKDGRVHGEAWHHQQCCAQYGLKTYMVGAAAAGSEVPPPPPPFVPGTATSPPPMSPPDCAPPTLSMSDMDKIILSLSEDEQSAAKLLFGEKLQEAFKGVVNTVTGAYGLKVDGSNRTIPMNKYEIFMRDNKVHLEQYTMAQRNKIWDIWKYHLDEKEAKAKHARLSAKIDINTCTLTELADMSNLLSMELRRSILRLREEKPGKVFKEYQELLEIGNLGVATFKSILPFLKGIPETDVAALIAQIPKNKKKSAILAAMSRRQALLRAEARGQAPSSSESSPETPSGSAGSKGSKPRYHVNVTEHVPDAPHAFSRELINAVRETLGQSAGDVVKEHWTFNRRRDAHRRTEGDEELTSDGRRRNFIGLVRGSRKPGQMWFDTGCRRCVSGPVDHRKMQQKLALYGLKPRKLECREEFVFGDGETQESEFSYEYPVFLKGKFVGLIDIALLEVPCPPLFSLGMAKKWACKTDHEVGVIEIKKFNHKVYFSDTPYLNILEIDYKGRQPIIEDLPEDFIDPTLLIIEKKE